MSRLLACLLGLALLGVSAPAVAGTCPGYRELTLPSPAVDPSEVDEPGRALYAEILRADREGLPCLVRAGLDLAMSGKEREHYTRGGPVTQVVGVWLHVAQALALEEDDLLVKAQDLFQDIDQRSVEGPAQDAANFLGETLRNSVQVPERQTIKSTGDGVYVRSAKGLGEVERALNKWWKPRAKQPVLLQIVVRNPGTGHVEIQARGASVRIDHDGSLLIEGIETPQGESTFERELGARWARTAGSNEVLLALDGESMLLSINDASSPLLTLGRKHRNETEIRLKLKGEMRIDELKLSEAQ